MFASRVSDVYTGRMRAWDHRTIDRTSAAADRLIARRLRRDPRMLQKARRNLTRWMAREGGKVAPVLQEWAGILDTLTRTELAEFLERGTPRARRLRQSTPFLGLLITGDLRRLRQV
jgi:hypothetical protein